MEKTLHPKTHQDKEWQQQQQQKELNLNSQRKLDNPFQLKTNCWWRTKTEDCYYLTHKYTYATLPFSGEMIQSVLKFC